MTQMAKEEYNVRMHISTIGLAPGCREFLGRNIKDAIEAHAPALQCSKIRITKPRKHGGDL